LLAGDANVNIFNVDGILAKDNISVLNMFAKKRGLGGPNGNVNRSLELESSKLSAISL
jgi:hypothetical protein